MTDTTEPCTSRLLEIEALREYDTRNPFIRNRHGQSGMDFLLDLSREFPDFVLVLLCEIVWEVWFDISACDEKW